MKNLAELKNELEIVIDNLGIHELVQKVLNSKGNSVNFFRTNQQNLHRLFENPEVFLSEKFVTSKNLNKLWKLLFNKILEDFESEKAEKLFFLSAFFRCIVKKKLSAKIKLNVEKLQKILKNVLENEEQVLGNAEFFEMLNHFVKKLHYCFIVDDEGVRFILSNPEKIKMKLLDFVDFKKLDDRNLELFTNELSRFTIRELFQNNPQVLQNYANTRNSKFDFKEIKSFFGMMIRNKLSGKRSKNPKIQINLICIFTSLIFKLEFSLEERNIMFEFFEIYFFEFKRILLKKGQNIENWEFQIGLKIFHMFLKKLIKFLNLKNFTGKKEFILGVQKPIFSILTHFIFARQNEDFNLKECFYFVQQIYPEIANEEILKSLKNLLSKDEIKKEVLISFFAKLNSFFAEIFPESLYEFFEEKVLHLLTSEETQINKNLGEYFGYRLMVLSNRKNIKSEKRILEIFDLILRNDLMFILEMNFSRLEIELFNFSNNLVTEYLELLEQMEVKPNFNWNIKYISFKNFLKFLCKKDEKLVLDFFVWKIKKNRNELLLSRQNLETKVVEEKMQILAKWTVCLPGTLLEKFNIEDLDFLFEIFQESTKKLTELNAEFFCHLVKKISKVFKKTSPKKISEIAKKKLAKFENLTSENFGENFSEVFINDFLLLSLLVYNENGLIMSDEIVLLSKFEKIQKLGFEYMHQHKILNSNFCWALRLVAFPVISLELRDSQIKSEVEKTMHKRKIFSAYFVFNDLEIINLRKIMKKKVKMLVLKKRDLKIELTSKKADFANLVFFKSWSSYESVDYNYPRGLVLHSNLTGSYKGIVDFLEWLGIFYKDEPDFDLNKNVFYLSSVFALLANSRLPSFEIFGGIILGLEKILASNINFENKAIILGSIFNIYGRRSLFFGPEIGAKFEEMRVGENQTKLGKICRGILRLFFYGKLKNEIDGEFSGEMFKLTNLTDIFNKAYFSIYLELFKENSLIRRSKRVSDNKLKENNPNILISTKTISFKVEEGRNEEVESLTPSADFYFQLLKKINEDVRENSVQKVPQILEQLSGLKQKGNLAEKLSSGTNLCILQSLLVVSSGEGQERFTGVYKRYIGDEESEKSHLRTVVSSLLFEIANRSVWSKKLEDLFLEELGFLLRNFRVNNLEIMFKYMLKVLRPQKLNLRFMKEIFVSLVRINTTNSFILLVYFLTFGEYFFVDFGVQNAVLNKLQSMTELNSNQQFFVFKTQRLLLENYISSFKQANEIPAKNALQFYEKIILRFSELCAWNSINFEYFCGEIKKMSQLDFEIPFLQKLQEINFKKLLVFFEDENILKSGKEKLISELENKLEINFLEILEVEKLKEILEILRKNESRFAELGVCYIFTKNCLINRKLGLFLFSFEIIFGEASFFMLQKYELFVKKLAVKLSSRENEEMLSFLENVKIDRKMIWLLNAFLPSLHGNLGCVSRMLGLVEMVLGVNGFEKEKEKLEKSAAEFGYLLSSFVNVDGIEIDQTLIRRMVKENANVAYLC